MDVIADALIYAVSHIDGRAGDDDRDVCALESIAHILKNTTPTEKDALAAAAERALGDERSSPASRAEFIRDYEQWMENMFGEDWHGNRRI